MTTATIPIPQRFLVEIVSSAPISTHYFERTRINIKVTNISKESVLIECATLQFEADTETAPNYQDHPTALRLSPNESGLIEVDVTPVPLFLEYTNQFQVGLKAHVESGGRLSVPFWERHKAYYIIINPPTLSLGDIFISFKQPEDLRLANILERYAKRAGFNPHLFMRNPAIGRDQWDEIEMLIKRCHSVIIVWSLRTEWGEGVEKEIELCRQYSCREILLVAAGVEPPKIYDSKLAYQRFDPNDPAKGLSEAIRSLRDQVIASSVS